jgi:MerR family transcriptional regulator, light-induced transcriptional regulator
VQGLDADDLRGLVANEWFGVVGISVSTEQQIGGLSDLVVAIREASLNKHVGVMVGGPVFTHSPERALEFGADGTAVNAPAAVLLAKKLLVRSISSEG